MIDARRGAVLKHVRRLYETGTTSSSSEGHLLDRFLTRRDETAFEALVARHGPMVLGICRRMLRDPRDVEDAFQATFLVLVQKAGTIRDRELLGNWLYGVAHRVSVRARANLARRPAEADLSGLADERAGSNPEEFELRAVLDEELGHLPEKYRAPIVLCYLEGHTHEEAATRLRWPVGTVRGRLARARELLRGRLARRGLAPASVALTAALCRDAKAGIPGSMAMDAVRAATSGAASHAVTAGAVSATALALADGVLRTLTMMKWKLIVAGMLAATVVAGSAVATARQERGGADSSDVLNAAPAPKPDEPRAPIPAQKPERPALPRAAFEGIPGARSTSEVPKVTSPTRKVGGNLNDQPRQALFNAARRVARLDADRLLKETRANVDEAVAALEGEVGTLTKRLDKARTDLSRLRAVQAALHAKHEISLDVRGDLRPVEPPGNALPGTAPVDLELPNPSAIPGDGAIGDPADVAPLPPPPPPSEPLLPDNPAPATTVQADAAAGPSSSSGEPRSAGDDHRTTAQTPHLIKVGDVLQVEVLEALPGRPITGLKPVRTDGTISLGFYGDLQVTGLTRREVKVKVVEYMRKYVKDEALGLLDYDSQTNNQVRIDPANTDRVFVDDCPYLGSTSEQRVKELERKLDRIVQEPKSPRGRVKE